MTALRGLPSQELFTSGPPAWVLCGMSRIVKRASVHSARAADAARRLGWLKGSSEVEGGKRKENAGTPFILRYHSLLFSFSFLVQVLISDVLQVLLPPCLLRRPVLAPLLGLVWTHLVVHVPLVCFCGYCLRCMFLVYS